jgi:hypothetical protein
VIQSSASKKNEIFDVKFLAAEVKMAEVDVAKVIWHRLA